MRVPTQVRFNRAWQILQRQGSAGGGESAITGTVTTPAGVYAGNAPFVSGSLAGGTAAKARLYSVTDGAYSGAAVDAYVSGGAWVCGNLPATAGTAKTYRIDLLASDGTTVIQPGGNFDTAIWTKPADAWRAAIATGEASATNGAGIFDSSANTTDMAALQSSGTSKTLVPISVGVATLGATLTLTSATPAIGSGFVTVVAPSHGLVAGDWVNGSGNGTITGNLAIGYVDANTFTLKINSTSATNTPLAGCVFKKITPTIRTIGYALPAVAAPGAIVYATWKNNSGNDVKATVSSTSFAAGSPTALTVTQPRPATFQAPDTYADRGAVVQVPTNAGTSYVKVALENYDSVTVAICWVGAFQLRSDNNHALFLLHGPSITHYAGLTMELRTYYQSLYPNSDPVFINWGHPGATYDTINTGSVVPSMATTIPWGYALYDADPNDVGTPRPYSGNTGNVIANSLDAGVSLLKAGMPAARPIYVANGDYFNAPDKAPTSAVKSGGNTGNGTITVGLLAKNGAWQLRMLSATTFQMTDPDGAITGPHATGATIDARFHTGFRVTVGGTPMVAGDGWDFTAVNAVDGLRGQDRGMKPYNDNLILPKLRAMTGVIAMRAPIDAPQHDAYTGPAVVWDVGLNTEGTHPSLQGYQDYYEHTFLPMFRHSQSGDAGNSRIEDLTDAVAGSSIPSVWDARLTAAMAALPATSDAVATTRRAQLSATIAAAAAASYAEPTVPTGATPFVWMDPANPSRVTLSSGLHVASVADRIGAWNWVATSVANNAPPAWMPAKIKGRAALRFGQRSFGLGGAATATGLECTDAGFLAAHSAAVGAAQAPCTYIWVERSHPTLQFFSSGGISWHFSNNTTSLVQFAVATPQTPLIKTIRYASILLSEPAATVPMTVNVYVMTNASGTNGAWILYRNGVAVTTSAITKPVWTAATILRLGMSSALNGSASAQDMGDWMAFAGVLSTTDRQAWEAYLTAKWVS